MIGRRYNRSRYRRQKNKKNVIISIICLLIIGGVVVGIKFIPKSNKENVQVTTKPDEEIDSGDKEVVNNSEDKDVTDNFEEVESNILDDKGNIDYDDKIGDVLDYVMAGYHFGSKPTNVKALINHANNYVFKTEKAKEYNTLGIINAMKNNNIFVITHPGDKGEIYIEEVAKVAKETNTKLEINSSHRFLNANQLRQIEHIGNTFIVGSDAHVPQNVGNFNLALNTIKEAKIDLSLIENIKF